MEININTDRELYIITEGHHTTCLGFHVVADKSRKMVKWLKDNDVYEKEYSDIGTIEAYDHYQHLLNVVRDLCHTRSIRCDIDLCEQLVGKEGKTVEIIDKYNETRRFIVGKSTGWIPCHLEIDSRHSDGGFAVTGDPFKSVKVLSK